MFWGEIVFVWPRLWSLLFLSCTCLFMLYRWTQSHSYLHVWTSPLDCGEETHKNETLSKQKVSNVPTETTLCTIIQFCNSSVNVNCVSFSFWSTTCSQLLKERLGERFIFHEYSVIFEFVSTDKSALKKERKTWERRWSENNSNEKEIIFFFRLVSWCLNGCTFRSPFSYFPLSLRSQNNFVLHGPKDTWISFSFSFHHVHIVKFKPRTWSCGRFRGTHIVYPKQSCCLSIGCLRPSANRKWIILQMKKYTWFVYPSFIPIPFEISEERLLTRAVNPLKYRIFLKLSPLQPKNRK